MGLALLGFLVLILVILRRDLQQPPSMPVAVPAARLTTDAIGQSNSFKLDEINLIGRAADNTIVLAEKSVSAHHARLSYLSGNQWWLEDMGSRNGTIVNGLPVDQPLAVTDGDQISFGSVTCELIVDGARSNKSV